MRRDLPHLYLYLLLSLSSSFSIATYLACGVGVRDAEAAGGGLDRRLFYPANNERAGGRAACSRRNELNKIGLRIHKYEGPHLSLPLPVHYRSSDGGRTIFFLVRRALPAG